MKKILTIIGTTTLACCLFYACKKKTTDDTPTIAAAKIQPLLGGAIPAGTVTGGTYTANATFTSGNTYNITGTIIIAKGDTLLLQDNVKLCMSSGVSIIVKGAFISLGTEASPNTITACSATKINTIAQGESPTTDPAFNGPGSTGSSDGWWCGINCDTSATLCVIKWTHVDFTGATFPSTEPFVGGTQGGISYGVLFQHLHGNLIIEDSWFYGGCDDLVRIQYGNLSIMRNTFEKNGGPSGDVLNAKGGSVGDMAYNLFMGTCTNGTKASNKGAGLLYPECQINMYNNTYVDGGYRQAGWAGRSGCIDFEQGASGVSYNNLIVNCRTGMRIVLNPIADTAHIYYSNNYIYCDSINADTANNIVKNIWPLQNITHANAYVFPSAAQAASVGYVYNATTGAAPYNANSLHGKGNPMFKNFPLPEPGISHFYDISYVGSSDFHLATGSPCIGTGYTAFSALKATAAVTNPNYAATPTAPGADIGCYQSNGTGNQH